MTVRQYLDSFISFCPYIELFISVPCIIINIYCAIRLANLNTFNNNFRIIMVISNFFGAGVSLFHPLVTMIPPEYVSYQNGYYFRGTSFYVIAFIHHWCVVIFDIKFFILGFERWFAFKSRATYEYSHDSTSIKIYLCIIFTAFCGLTAKIISYVKFHHNDTVDMTLQKAFVVDNDLPTLLAAHVMALSGWTYAMTIFRQVERQAEENRFRAQTLSESYQIKETINIISVIGPIIRAYITLVLLCGTFLSVNLYCIYYGYWSMSSIYYQSLTNFEYIMINTYNFYSSSYMIWYLRPLRKVFLNDLRSCFNCSIDIDNQVDTTVKRFDDEAKIYFDQLQNQWL
ncbi:unnamed protein product [Bursaphelenchus okinawaensis]|uniref:G_PROTEIN_RECEP_F1_2 domain-containing protein n=1 Tax=Bursaphelenchus okinawaensis TaxID=465554 RepID=A0A811LPH5_9BILA|nr:unnamed protein product [Bursaphelenchus okinawaensis]CAG9127608.1 unnamed protein product [Bursaphelenchus okinawaensis]